MSRCFEDEFMDVQADIISLGLEMLEIDGKEADKIFAYCCNEICISSFDAFFEQDGEIKTLRGMGINPHLAGKFQDLGMEEIKNIKKVCAKYNMPSPTEIKLYYDVKTNRLKAEYQYDEVLGDDINVAPCDIFERWIEEEKQRLAAN